MPKVEVPEGDTALLEKVMTMVENAPEPSASEDGKVIHQSDEDLPMTIVKGKVSSAGYVTVYNRETGEPSVINKNMLFNQLKKKLENGQRAFTTKRSEAPIPYRGTFKCMLHPTDDRREHFDRMGIPVCNKDNIPNDYQLLRHMQIKHKTAWAQIEKERQDAERAADRKWQESLIRIAEGKGLGDAQVKGAPKNFVCPECPKAFETEAQLRGHKMSHKKK